MTIEYRVTEKDYATFQVFHALRSRSWWVISALPLILFVIITMPFFMAEFSNPESGEVPLWAYLFVLALFYITIGAVMAATKAIGIHLITKMQFREGKNSHFVGRQVLLLREDHFEEQNATASTRFIYPAIERIRFHRGCLYIYVGATRALIVPLSAFQNAGQRTAFLTHIWEKTGIAVADRKFYRIFS